MAGTLRGTRCQSWTKVPARSKYCLAVPSNGIWTSQRPCVHNLMFISGELTPPLTTQGQSIRSWSPPCRYFIPPQHYLNFLRQVLGRCNPRTLAIKPQRNCQQPKDPHDHTKDTERKRRASRDDPIGDEERPSESNDGAHDGCHDEAIAVHGLVGVDELVSVSE
jgi:hypothetical protein